MQGIDSFNYIQINLFYLIGILAMTAERNTLTWQSMPASPSTRWGVPAAEETSDIYKLVAETFM